MNERDFEQKILVQFGTMTSELSHLRTAVDGLKSELQRLRESQVTRSEHTALDLRVKNLEGDGASVRRVQGHRQDRHWAGRIGCDRGPRRHPNALLGVGRPGGTTTASREPRSPCGNRLLVGVDHQRPGVPAWWLGVSGELPVLPRVLRRGGREIRAGLRPGSSWFGMGTALAVRRLLRIEETE